MNQFGRDRVVDGVVTLLLFWVCVCISVVCSGCTTTGSKPPAVGYPVSIVSWPKTQDKVDCYLTDNVVPPDAPVWPSADEDFYRRVYVHRKDYEDSLQAIRDLAQQNQALHECVMKLIEASDR